MDGYAKLATLMGAYPEVAIVRRFSALNAQSVIYLQAELVYLEARLRRYEEEDRKSGDQARIDFALDFTKLSSSTLDETCQNMTDEDTEKILKGRRWSLMLQIREKLKAYNEAVLQQTALAHLKRPNPRDLRFLTEWMERPDMGNVLLESMDSDVYENPDRLDLVVLKPRKSESLLTTWLSDTVVHYFHQKIGYRISKWLSSTPKPAGSSAEHDGEAEGNAVANPTQNSFEMDTRKLDTIAESTGMTYHSQTSLLRIGRILAMTLSSMLPIGAIVVLYVVKDMSKRLGIVAGFTAGFSLVLGLVTNGELIDVFAASAAFAAVQVVFVGSTNPGNGTTSHVT
ncbi:hypothetical protein B0J14DRAFT_156745 [Halenospora varia]|nr:hypothetical protein B0J14DRAFT_156745 [Halenospora varia]